MSTHVMIDIETMGDGNEAALLSIGAVKFDPLIDGVLDSFYVAISLASSVAHGLKMSPSTVEWWLDPERQPAWIRYAAEEKHDLYTAMDAFAHWYGPESLPTWGNGATFDNIITRSGFDKAGVPMPWKFWDDRCYRTLKNLAPDVKLVRQGVHHNALDDAVSQALHMQQVVAHLKELGALKI